MKTATYIFATLVVPALMTGCAAVESVNKYIDEKDRLEEDARFEKARVACQRYGFADGTDRFSACLQTEVNNIKTREAIADRASKDSLPGPDNMQKTTSCIRTLTGMQCTTQ